MLRKLLLSVGQVSSVSLLNAVAALLVGVVTARLLGPAGSGEINFILTVSSVVLLAVGMSTGIALRLEAGGRPGPGLLASYNSLSVLQGALSAALVAAVVFWAGFTSPWLVAGSALIAFWMSGARQVQESLKACGYVLNSVVGVGIGHSGRLLVTLLAVALVPFSLKAAVVAAMFGQLTQVLAGALKLRKVPGGTQFARGVRHWGALIAGGLRSQGYILGGVAIERSSRLMVLPMIGAHEAGLFVAAGTLTESLRMFAISAGQVLFVKVSEGESRDAGRLKWVVFGVEAVGAAVLWFLAPVVIELLYGREFERAVGLLRGLLVAELFMAFATMDGRALLGASDLTFLSRSTVAVAVLTLLAQWVLILQFGVWGAVWGTAAAYALWALVLRLRSRHVESSG